MEEKGAKNPPKGDRRNPVSVLCGDGVNMLHRRFSCKRYKVVYTEF